MYNVPQAHRESADMLSTTSVQVLSEMLITGQLSRLVPYNLYIVNVAADTRKTRPRMQTYSSRAGLMLN